MTVLAHPTVATAKIEKHRFDVSLRMSVFYGPGAMPPDADGLHPVRLAFAIGGDAGLPLVTVGGPGDDARDADIVFLVDPEGCREVLGAMPEETGSWHLTSAQRALALTLLGCDLPEPARSAMRTIKALELLCVVVLDLSEGRLVPAGPRAALGELDSRRIVMARQLIDREWRDGLTLNGIARRCGLNRVKLTRGFRDMYDCSVGEAIAERRLGGARQLLLVTSLPVSSIGYQCGYRNNAAFTRAFTRRFGQAPTQLRARAAAA